MRLVVICFSTRILVMFIRTFFFTFSLFYSIDSLSHQEDLSIENYFHLACLKLKVENEFLLDYHQDETHQPYQSFFSSDMSVDLCFRLCRRSIVVTNQNENQCFCFFVVTKFYEFENYFGQILDVRQCSSNTLKIFSLTKHSYLLQTPTATHDWTLDGCYYLQGIQTVRADFNLQNYNYSFGMDVCRRYCQLNRNTSFFSFFISMKKSCYCLPVRITSAVQSLAVRKPLTHCSFLPVIQSLFDRQMNTSEIPSETVVKIDVQRFCSSTFIFDRFFYRCLKFSPLNKFNNPMKLNDDERCSPILIQTIDEWNYFKTFSFVLRTRTFIWLDRRSTYLLEKSNSSFFDEFCLVASRNNSTGETIFDLDSCSNATFLDFTLCSQKPLKTILDENVDLQLQRHASDRLIDRHSTCPKDFLLFNSFCYFVYPSFVNNLRSAEEICFQHYRNSSLVKFSKHDWSNVNGTRFFGRSQEDVLLELFYYQLERRTSKKTNENQQRHWLRILLADQDDPNACIIRYFTRSSGSFTKLLKCNFGGHPVCRTEPIRLATEISTTTTTTTDEMTTDFVDLTNQSNVSVVEQNFTTIFVPDEDLDVVNLVVEKKSSRRKNSRALILIISGPLFAFLFLLVGFIVLVRFIRSSRDSYSPGQFILNGSYRRKRYSSPTMSSTENSQTPAVLYTRLKSHSISGVSSDDDHIRLLPPQVLLNKNLHENAIKENDDDDNDESQEKK